MSKELIAYIIGAIIGLLIGFAIILLLKTVEAKFICGIFGVFNG